MIKTYIKRRSLFLIESVFLLLEFDFRTFEFSKCAVAIAHNDSGCCFFRYRLLEGCLMVGDEIHTHIVYLHSKELCNFATSQVRDLRY